MIFVECYFFAEFDLFEAVFCLFVNRNNEDNVNIFFLEEEQGLVFDMPHSLKDHLATFACVDLMTGNIYAKQAFLRTLLAIMNFPFVLI